jgi:uncharacterized protein
METAQVGSGQSASREGLLARHPLISFSIIAYAGSWLVILPYVRLPNGAALLPFDWPIPFVVSAVLAPFAGPFLAAFIMSGATEGKAGVGRLLRQIVLWRVGIQWYLFALVGIPILAVLGSIVLPGVLTSFQMPPVSWLPSYLVAFVVCFFVGGPLGEEPGWRGFALPRLQKQFGPFVGTLILAPIHVLWHLPLFWVPQWNTARETVLDVVWYGLSGIAMTVVFTWLFNNTKGSVLLAALAHTSMDAFFVGHFFTAPIVTGTGVLPFVTGLVPAALLMIIVTRGSLSYARYRREVEHQQRAATAP